MIGTPMAFTVTWDDDAQMILRFNSGHGWTWQGFRDIKEMGDKMIDQASHSQPIGVMLVLPDGFHLPPNAIINTRKAIMERHPRAATLTIVTGNNNLKNLYDILVKIYPPSADICFLSETIEQARAQLRERLATLSQRV